MKTLALFGTLTLGAFAAATIQPPATAGGTSLPTITELASGSEDFETLTALLGAAGLADALDGPGPFTVFAPTDDAFDALPPELTNALLQPENADVLANVLKYHVVAGEVPAAVATSLPYARATNGQRIPFVFDPNVGFFVDGAEVVTTDIQCANGVVHVISDVMLPAIQNTVATARSEGDFTTLFAALQATGFDDPLANAGPYTVFAPTDAAFADLPDGLLETLLAEEDLVTLSAILGFHVVEGRYYASELPNANLTTLQGQRLRFRDNGTHIGVNGAKIVQGNVVTSNGMIHVIDKVMTPAAN